MKIILDEIKKRRSYDKSYTTQADVKRIQDAKDTGNWEAVYKSRLYKLHGGEYCELLSVIHKYAN